MHIHGDGVTLGFRTTIQMRHVVFTRTVFRSSVTGQQKKIALIEVLRKDTLPLYVWMSSVGRSCLFTTCSLRPQAFSQWLLQQCVRNPIFLPPTLLRDEAGFACGGNMIFHN